MNRYLISLDLDGTLLNKKRKISYRTKLYLKKLIKKGHIITFSTGRSYRNVKKYANQLGIKDLLVINNGNIIFNNEIESVVLENPIPLNPIIKIYNLIKDKYLESYILETFDSLYYNNEDRFWFAFMNSEDMNLYKTNDFEKIISGNIIASVFYIHDNTKKNEIISLLSPFLSEIDYRFWFNDHYFEINRKNVSKASGLLYLMKKYNILKDNVIVFGDAENDAEMFKTFANSFLMKNGNKSLKEYAKYITKKDNNHNGIVHSLKDFFKNKN